MLYTLARETFLRNMLWSIKSSEVVKKKVHGSNESGLQTASWIGSVLLGYINVCPY